MNDKTPHLRQVHPDFVPEGRLSSAAFRPFPNDLGMLSVYDGDQISPHAAYNHYIEIQKLQSAGVWAVNGEEITEVGLSSEPDPLEGFQAHALINFNSHSPKDARKIAKKLRDLAADRGCLHSP